MLEYYAQTGNNIWLNVLNTSQQKTEKMLFVPVLVKHSPCRSLHWKVCCSFRDVISAVFREFHAATRTLALYHFPRL